MFLSLNCNGLSPRLVGFPPVRGAAGGGPGSAFSGEEDARGRGVGALVRCVGGFNSAGRGCGGTRVDVGGDAAVVFSSFLNRSEEDAVAGKAEAGPP